MKLYIDLGNTRLKWMLDNKTMHAIIWENKLQLNTLLNKWKKQSISQVFWVSTANDTINTQLTDFFKQQNITTERFSSLYKHTKIKPSYNNQSQLGDDRWLSLVSAYKQQTQPYCIISAGTAITVDLVYKDQHYPSIIIPSERLMRESLQQKTSQVDTSVEASKKEPTNTQQCVQLGIQTAIFSAIEVTIAYYQHKFKQAINITLTGGDAKWLNDKLTLTSTIDEKLIIKGLKIAFH